jgi:hypothetical protein
MHPSPLPSSIIAEETIILFCGRNTKYIILSAHRIISSSESVLPKIPWMWSAPKKRRGSKNSRKEKKCRLVMNIVQFITKRQKIFSQYFFLTENFFLTRIFSLIFHFSWETERNVLKKNVPEKNSVPPKKKGCFLPFSYELHKLS